ncbi:L-aspartate oxidase [Asticcacaulis machinosus]|uniref:L-aspartate oxidase n=1 Tax=Asticcacaulis machinosus TaxID=2984211 RepID=A0ABT5HJI2_9CAUL|nr:L-aspartate oxidase [Asticcacaulis machinosus]MDC7675759.1 L-aspartate oxidase [Asticcacaulis machinosus]
MAAETYIHNGPLVIGAGLAGLSVALHTAPLKTLVLAPVALGVACSSAWAQGGIAAALSDQDTPEAHAKDTLDAGAGIVDPLAARTLTEMGKHVVKQLSDLGAPFDRNTDGSFVLNREAAHGLARVARVGGDLAGKAILTAVADAARNAPHIEIWEQAFATGLITSPDGAVIGAVVSHEGKTLHVYAPVTVMASGGLGGLYAVTTNPPNLRGDGMAMAALAGAVIADPEFVQFHPTALNVGLDPAPLATEALRGEGATLIDKNGVRFVLEDHPDGELAPRDIVARAVHKANVSGRGAFLDATTAIGDHFPAEFPTVFASCQSVGIDPRTEPMPVAPAAHYHMGGISTDIHGRSSLKGLYAVGECASTGVHGANRLASNSLLEAAAFGERVGLECAQTLSDTPFTPDTAAAAIPALPPVLPPETLQSLRDAISRYAGVVRDETGLKTLLEQIEDLEKQYAGSLALINARLIALSALRRKESRGSHYRSDYPMLSDRAQRTFTTWSQCSATTPEPQLEIF